MTTQFLNRIKRWLSDGPTVAFSRRYRYTCWAFNLLLYALLNLFLLRLYTGGWIPWQHSFEASSLTERLLSPLSIFDFPAYIFVLALLMALLCVLPILTAQLYNFWHAIPFPAVVLLCGHQNILSLCLLVSCAAVSFHPFRFKSKFVAAVMCLIPELLYVIIFRGPNPETEALRWAVLYAPWGLAFFFCLILFAIILCIGHFIRYRPGVITPVLGLVLAGTVLLFHGKIGMNERDFQAYVYRFRPETIINLHSKDIQPLLEEEKALWEKYFYYLNPDTFEDELMQEWENNFRLSSLTAVRNKTDTEAKSVQEAQKFLQTQDDAVSNIDHFIRMYPNDRRVADAYYYKGLILDLKPDVRQLRQKRRLAFYNDIPSATSEAVWAQLLDRFVESEVAIEARLRFAILSLQREEEKPDYKERFQQAADLLLEAQKRCRMLMDTRKEKEHQTSSQPSISDIFNPKSPIISDEQLHAMYLRIEKLRSLIEKENRPDNAVHEKRLVEFTRLDPYQLDYKTRLKALKLNAPQPDPLIDNIELAESMLIHDPERKGFELRKTIQNYPEQDGGNQARIELAKLYLEKFNRSNNDTDRETLLQNGRETLTPLLNLPPENIFAQQAVELRRKWPGVIHAKITNGQTSNPGPE